MQHAFRLAGGARGVKNEQRILGVHDFGIAFLADRPGRLVIADVALFVPGDFAVRAPHHENAMHVRAVFERLVDVILERDQAPAAHAFVGGDDGAAVGIENSVLERFGREAAEHHGMDGADAGAGEHCVGRFRDHRQIDADPVALADAAGLERVGELAYRPVQFAIADMLLLVGFVAFPDDCRLLAAARQMPVDAVIRHVEFSAFEPAHVGGAEIARRHLLPGLVPVQEAGGHFRPEFFRILDRLPVHGFELFAVQVTLGGGRIADRVDGVL